MYKNIQSYFKTESDAEEVRIKLEKYDTEDVLVDVIPDPPSKRVGLLVPFAASPTTGTGIGGQGQGIIPQRAATSYFGLGEVDKEADPNPDTLQYVLSAKVKKEDYEEIVDTIRRNGGYIAQEEED